jgi:plasmid stabilization system protein ParE
MRLTYSAEADENFLEILQYGAHHWGVDKAIEFVEFLREQISMLLDFPELGKPYDNEFIKTSGTLRAYNIQNYKVIYHISAKEIEVITILPKGRPPS